LSNSSRAPGDVEEVRYKNFAADLRELPVAIVNRIERERWGEFSALHDGLPTLLTHMVRVCGATWNAIEVLVLTKQHGERLPSELSVAVAPLERRVLDALMAVVFILESPRDRTDWYYRSGWREAAELHELLVQDLGGKPEWVRHLAEHRAWVDSHSDDLCITAEERAKPGLATVRWSSQRGWWPNPGRMSGIATGPTATYLRLLHTWLYGQLSADSHLSYMGLVRQGGVLQTQHDGPTRHQFRDTMCLSAMATFLAFLSEVATAASLPLEKKRARTVWQEMKVTFIGDKLWTNRYSTLLEGAE